MNPVWTITYNGTEQSAASWGLTAQPRIQTRDRSPTVISFRMAGAAPETGVPFPFKAQVIIRSNRTLVSGQWSVASGPSYVFTGYQTSQPGDVDGKSQGITLVFKDAIWLMQNTTFQQLWTIASTPASPDWVSRCVLFMDINSWVPNTYQSVQWQIQQIVSYAASCGIAIAPGTIDYSGWFLNYYHCRAASCWDALLKCLEPIPDAKVWIDGSTTPPQLNVRTRANLSALPSPLSGAAPGPITLPYKGVDSAGRQHHSTRGFTPRYDLIPPQVVLQYLINGTCNGKPAPTWTNDVYPAGSTGQMPFALVCPIDLTGASITAETGTLDCEPLMITFAQTGYASGSAADHAAKRAWWASQRGGATEKLADFRVRFGVATIGNATATDTNGNPVNLAAYPNRIVDGTYHSWMKNGTTQINALKAHIKVTVQFSEYDVAGSTPAETDTNGNLVRQAGSHELHLHAHLTNAPAGVTPFVGSQLTALAETPVPNLAQNIYNSRATLDYDGTHEIIDPGKVGVQPLGCIIGHWNVLNLSGGNVAWQTANMSISETEIDMLTAHIRIEVGPARHLQPQDWSAMLQFFRYRRLYLDSSVRATGLGSPNNSADMARNTPGENTVPGLAVDQKQGLVAIDAISGNQNVLTQDATINTITAAQNNPGTGTPIVVGYINPEYNGTGAPGASTLNPAAYYRNGDRYFDTTANALYYCTTSGTGNVGSSGGSVWVQVGGGSVQQFTFVSDGGDYLIATPATGGSSVKIAKPPKLRCSIASETYLDGTGVHTFTYTAVVNGGATVAYTRLNTWSAGSQTEQITPAYLPGDLMYAVGMPTLNMPVSPGSGTTVAVSLLDIHDKDWAT